MGAPSNSFTSTIQEISWSKETVTPLTAIPSSTVRVREKAKIYQSIKNTPNNWRDDMRGKPINNGIPSKQYTSPKLQEELSKPTKDVIMVEKMKDRKARAYKLHQALDVMKKPTE